MRAVALLINLVHRAARRFLPATRSERACSGVRSGRLVVARITEQRTARRLLRSKTSVDRRQGDLVARQQTRRAGRGHTATSALMLKGDDVCWSLCLPVFCLSGCFSSVLSIQKWNAESGALLTLRGILWEFKKTHFLQPAHHVICQAIAS